MCKAEVNWDIKLEQNIDPKLFVSPSSDSWRSQPGPNLWTKFATTTTTTGTTTTTTTTMTTTMMTIIFISTGKNYFLHLIVFRFKEPVCDNNVFKTLPLNENWSLEREDTQLFFFQARSLENGVLLKPDIYYYNQEATGGVIIMSSPSTPKPKKSFLVGCTAWSRSSWDRHQQYATNHHKGLADLILSVRLKAASLSELMPTAPGVPKQSSICPGLIRSYPVQSNRLAQSTRIVHACQWASSTSAPRQQPGSFVWLETRFDNWQIEEQQKKSEGEKQKPLKKNWESVFLPFSDL